MAEQQQPPAGQSPGTAGQPTGPVQPPLGKPRPQPFPPPPSGQGPDAPATPPAQPTEVAPQDQGGQGESPLPDLPENWMKSPQYAELKARWDRELSQYRQAVTDRDALILDLSGRIEALETADLDDLGQQTHANKKLQTENEQLREALRQRDEMDALYERKLADTKKLGERYGVEPFTLMQFETFAEAEQYAQNAWQERVMAEARGQTSGGAPPVDIGGGPQPGTSTLEAAMAKAQADGDRVLYTKLAWLGEEGLNQ